MHKRILELLLAAGFAAAAVFSPLSAGDAVAQSKCDDQADDDPEKRNYRTVIGPDGRKIFVIEKAFVVCGKVPKPTVIYVLQASTINYEWETLKQDFLPRVLESVKEAPF
jgi:hypothetical protein